LLEQKLRRAIEIAKNKLIENNLKEIQ
jgi:hypothetical protein